MKRILFLIIFCAACIPKGQNRDQASSFPEPDSADRRLVESPVISGQKKHKLSILVLPPYDKIAGKGTSPNTRGIMETLLSKHSGFEVIPFPFRELMGTSHQMVYDKKYCPPILERISCDIIIMTHLQTSRELKVDTRQWRYDTKVFNPRTGKETLSIKGKGLAAEEFKADIEHKKDELIESILSTF